MATEPKYDEDLVNLGYFKKIINNVSENIELPDNISKHYSSKPQPPYHKGDTWINGTIIYTCINDREIGIYVDTDWVTESGAREEAERKNKVFLTKPTSYNVGDMWILQSDEDHKAGRKGEILVSVAGRKEYEANDWINQLGYGTIRSINEVANNINDALERMKATKEEGIVTIFYSENIPQEQIDGDYWYVINNIDKYVKENLYKFNGIEWEIVNDKLTAVAFEEANEARLVEDGKIQSFYSAEIPSKGMGVGDIWTNTVTKKLYRYNGTNWVAVYDTNISDIRKDIETITETTTEIVTDLGKITQQVSEVETQITTLGYMEEAQGITQIVLEDAKNAEIVKLEIKGNKTYEDNLYPQAELFPSEIYPNEVI